MKLKLTLIIVVVFLIGFASGMSKWGKLTLYKTALFPSIHEYMEGWSNGWTAGVNSVLQYPEAYARLQHLRK